MSAGQYPGPDIRCLISFGCKLSVDLCPALASLCHKTPIRPLIGSWTRPSDWLMCLGWTLLGTCHPRPDHSGVQGGVTVMLS